MAFSLTDISLGELRDLGPSDKGSDMFGLYVVEPPIQDNGILVSIESRGFFIMSMEQRQYQLRILVYRAICYNGAYEEVYRETFVYTNDDNKTYGYIRSDVRICVQRGDLIAVHTRRRCNNQFCPFQPAIMSNVTTPVMYSEQADINIVQPLANIFLNVRANITGKCHNLVNNRIFLHMSTFILFSTSADWSTTLSSVIINSFIVNCCSRGTYGYFLSFKAEYVFVIACASSINLLLPSHCFYHH